MYHFKRLIASGNFTTSTGRVTSILATFVCKIIGNVASIDVTRPVAQNYLNIRYHAWIFTKRASYFMIIFIYLIQLISIHQKTFIRFYAFGFFCALLSEIYLSKENETNFPPTDAYFCQVELSNWC